jgi:hypothetical protein
MPGTPTVQEILRGREGRREKERLRQEKQLLDDQQKQARPAPSSPSAKTATPRSSHDEPPSAITDPTSAAPRRARHTTPPQTLPEHLRPTASDESSDDADAEDSDDDGGDQDDASAARGRRSTRALPDRQKTRTKAKSKGSLQAVDMNRSLFSMIRAAGSAAAASWLDDAAGDSDSDLDPAAAAAAAAATAAAAGDGAGLAASAPPHLFAARRKKAKRLGTIEERAGVVPPEEEGEDDEDDPDGRGLAESQLLRRGGQEAPFLSMMLKGEKDMEASMTLEPQDGAAEASGERPSSATLAQRLVEVFGLPEPEEVLAGKSSGVRMKADGRRISVLAAPDGAAQRAHVRHEGPHLLLRVHAAQPGRCRQEGLPREARPARPAVYAVSLRAQGRRGAVLRRRGADIHAQGQHRPPL